MRDILNRILGVIVAMFMIAVLYGIIVTTMDFTEPGYSPETSAHKASNNVYSLFGSVTGEVKRNEAEAHEGTPVQTTSIMSKIAMPFALTADLSALFFGKLEEGVRALFRKLDIGN